MCVIVCVGCVCVVFCVCVLCVICVCSGGTSSDSSTIKEAVSCHFDLTFLPCCLLPPDIPCDGDGSLDGRIHYVLCIVRYWVLCCDVYMTFFVSYIKLPADRRTDGRAY